MAGRSGRHRPRLAGAAGLILILALAAPAAAQAGPTLVSWERSGGLLGLQDRVRILKDRTIFATAGEESGQARITRREKRRLTTRLEGWRQWKARYEPDVLVLDGITVSARARGHRVSVSTGADAPRRVDRVMGLLSRLHEKYLDAADGSAAAGPTLLTWRRSVASRQFPQRIRIDEDRTIAGLGEDAGREGRLTRPRMEALRARLRGWRRYDARYAPEERRPDQATVTVRHKGHTVAVTEEAEVPPRLARALRLIARLRAEHLFA